MNKGVKFAFGIHNHQPLGNFEGTFEEAYSHAYMPFIDSLIQHPQIRIALHMPGILWEWTESKHPEFFDLVAELLDRDQIELMTGGYYEPILPMIPDSDKVGQIQKLTEYLERKFNVQPVGMWVAERVWEPQMAAPIAQAGVKYVCLDDSHFKMAGLKTEQLRGYYVTEDNGHSLAVFPIDMQMRYAIPFMPPEKTIQYLRSVSTPFRDHLIVLADDGEKFGVWPGTYHSVYEEGWLERFFTMMEENSDWVEMVLFGEYLANHSSQGSVYLPTASYTEMMEWALPAPETMALEDVIEETKAAGHEDYHRFLKGGFWRNFLSKYPESNSMHKKMLHVHSKIDSLPQDKREAALDKLWAGQCNCSYWHGVFGGLYLNHIRAAVYGNLIEAENIADQTLHPEGFLADAQMKDFFCDGTTTLLCSNRDMNAYFHLTRGGALFEWDLRAKSFNVLNTLSRRLEAYHRKVLELAEIEAEGGQRETGDKSIHDILKAKETGLEEYLIYDWYRRSAFIDHFLGSETTLEIYRRVLYEEQGDFILEPSECQVTHNGDGLRLNLRQTGGVMQEGREHPVLLEKVFHFPTEGTALEVDYRVTNSSDSPLSLWFGTECNLALQAGNTDDRYYLFPEEPETKQLLGSIGEEPDLAWIGLVEEWLGIEIVWSFTRPALVWRFPIETVQNSEAGFERSYQCSSLLATWKFDLEPQQSFEVSMTLEAQNL